MLIRMGMGGQLSGSVGGVVASRNRYGAYLRNRTVPTNPNTVRQQAARAAFGIAAVSWAGLTAAQRGLWQSYATETPLLNRLGESITLSANAMFVRTNAFRLNAGAGLLLDAPLTPGLSSLGSFLAAAASEASGVAFITSGADAVGPGIVLYSPIVSPGVQSFGGPFSRSVAVNYIASGFAPTPTTGTRYGPLVEGQIRYFRFQASDAEGKLSNIITSRVTVAA